jgi:hypothetical protein
MKVHFIFTQSSLEASAVLFIITHCDIFYNLQDKIINIYLNSYIGVSAGENYNPQLYLDRFAANPLSIDVSPTNYGVMSNEGVTYNWNSRMLAVCGGKQVNKTVEAAYND